MPRIDGYPAAEAPTGQELLPIMQGGKTRSLSADQLLAWIQAKMIQQPTYSPNTAVPGVAVLGRMVLGVR